MTKHRAHGGARLVDVARAAGVSTASASLALNGRPGVLPEKRERILEAARNLGYEANVVGRLLRAARTGTIGVYLPPTALNHDYYVDLLAGIAEALHEEDLSTLIIPNQWGRERPKLPRSVDAYIVAEPLLDDPGVQEIMSTGIPVVCGERPPEALPRPTAIVSYDHAALIREALDEVARAGAQRPALVRLGLDAQWADLIENGYRAWCAQRNAAPTLLSYDPFGDSVDASDQLRDELSSVLAPGDRGQDMIAETTDALIIGADVHAAPIASMVQDTAQANGDDIILVSLVDNPYFAMRRPSITAVDLDPKGFGARCAEAVLTAISTTDSPRPDRSETMPESEQESASQTVPVSLHPHRLIPRDSTRVAR